MHLPFKAVLVRILRRYSARASIMSRGLFHLTTYIPFELNVDTVKRLFRKVLFKHNITIHSNNETE